MITKSNPENFWISEITECLKSADVKQLKLILTFVLTFVS